LQQAKHGIPLLPERLPLRLDVWLDDIRRNVGDMGNPGGSSAYQVVSVADLHDVNGHVLGQRGRVDDRDQLLAGRGDDAATIEQANRVGQADQQQADDRKRPGRAKNELASQRIKSGRRRD
jgi:hypothetical protein